MFQAINNRVIGRLKTRKETTSGIILAAPVEGSIVELEVIATTELTKSLQDKTVYIERRHVAELKEENEYKYGSFKYEDIAAIKHD